jgi:hypothetical protein
VSIAQRLSKLERAALQPGGGGGRRGPEEYTDRELIEIIARAARAGELGPLPDGFDPDNPSDRDLEWVISRDGDNGL